MSQEDFERFRQTVLRDAELQRVLRETPDRESFVALAVGLGAERGCRFTTAEVEEALRASRRVLLERWI